MKQLIQTHNFRWKEREFKSTIHSTQKPSKTNTYREIGEREFFAHATALNPKRKASFMFCHNYNYRCSLLQHGDSMELGKSHKTDILLFLLFFYFAAFSISTSGQYSKTFLNKRYFSPNSTPFIFLLRRKEH